MLYPEFTENTETGVAMYFALNGKTESELIAALEKAYPCFSAVGPAERDGKKYVALTVDDDAV